MTELSLGHINNPLGPFVRPPALDALCLKVNLRGYKLYFPWDDFTHDTYKVILLHDVNSGLSLLLQLPI